MEYLYAIYLLAALIQLGYCDVTVLWVGLAGGSQPHIDARSKAQYVLKCDYRTGYDDQVSMVRWYKHNMLAYEWDADSVSPSVRPILQGHVNNFPEMEPANLHFVRPLEYSVAGNYTCEVTAQSGSTDSKNFILMVVDISSEEYATHVRLMSSKEEDQSTTDYSEDYSKDSSEPVEADLVHDGDDPDCTLVWSFSSPPIYPRPNVTCGFYSYLHNEIITALPAGLTMHQFTNGSWKAYFKHTPIHVSRIPKNDRLGCSVKIPDTNYERIMKYEDDTTIDLLIDTLGCPSLTKEPPHNLEIEITDAEITCRGEYTPTRRDSPVVASLSCPEGHTAIVNGEAIEDWSMRLTCSEYEMIWKFVSSDDLLADGETFNVEELPFCAPIFNGADSLSTRISTLLVMLTVLALSLQVH